MFLSDLPHYEQLPNYDSSWVYALIDPRDSRIRYIGCTKSNNLLQRSRNHGKGYNDATPRKQEWGNELRSMGLSPIMVLIQEVSDAERRVIENQWVQYCLEQGADLLNVCRRLRVKQG